MIFEHPADSVSMAVSRSPLVAGRKSQFLGLIISWSGCVSSSCSGLAHAVGVAVCGHQRNANALGLTQLVAWLAVPLGASAVGG